VGTWQPPTSLPASVRKFGRFPDVNALLPGDLILTQSVDCDWVSKRIRRAQYLGGQHPRDALWTHAAIYMGDRIRVIEANFDWFNWGQNGVKMAQLSDYVGDHRLRFRRFPGLTADERWLIVIAAMSRLNSPYRFRYLLSSLGAAARGFFRDRETQLATSRQAGFVCSTLYQDSVAKVTGRLIEETARVCTPGTLSSTRTLQDVPVGWLKIGTP
jgi:hypothetical protein